MDCIIREFKIGDLHDVELLAEMWNASDSGWLLGWTCGIYGPEVFILILAG